MDTVSALLQKSFDLTAPLVFFPVRHHSPACTLHLRRTLESYQPDCILIEGPADTNHLVEHIGSPENTAPLCIYYSYVHKGKEDEAGDYRSACYYPLLDFSPELAAIRYGVEHGVNTQFVDLPYSELSLVERERWAEEQEESPGETGKKAYYDDYYLARSQFIQRLCEKQGCRHYGELWEKLFELGGLSMDSREFVRSMLALCHYSRVEYPQEWLRSEGCLAREMHMAWKIGEARKAHSRVLVVTGGFHTAALAELCEEDCPAVKPRAGKGSAYLIPYSFTESDQLAGYASGMPYPGFYQEVYENMQEDPGAAYDGAVLRFVARIGGALRREKHSTSIADEVAALAQSRGLAALRDKPQQGVYELLDAVGSAYVKGEMSASASSMVGTATRLLRGDKMGSIASGVEQVPLLLDFRATAKRLRLKMDQAVKQEITLEILSKPIHREASVFFHRLQFLGAGFGELRSGPSYRERDTARVRETWRYAPSARVEAALVDVSYQGGTVREAASTALGKARREGVGCGEYSKLLIDAAVMDLTEHAAALLASMEAAVAEDGSFQSLALAAKNLLFLENAKWLLSLPDTAFGEKLLQAVYIKAAALLPTLETGVEEEDRLLAKSLKDLHQISRREGVDSSVLEEALQELCHRTDPEPPPCLQGSAAGLLYAGGAVDVEGVLDYARAYLFGSGIQMKRSGLFLGGLFLSAWDILFAENRFIEGISNVLETLPQDDFLTLLPDLRLAFSGFTPTQIDRLSGIVARLLQVGEQEVSAPAVPEGLLALGRRLDEYARQSLGLGEVPA